MTEHIIKVEDVEAFFERGRRLADLIDQGAEIPPSTIVSFDDPEDLLALLTTERIALFRAIKELPGSSSDLAERLRRDRDSIKRDVGRLREAGLIKVTQRLSPEGHPIGEISVVAPRFKLEAELA
jgi:predicted transcriptional regulator